jgi:hypothetical protein
VYFIRNPVTHKKAMERERFFESYLKVLKDEKAILNFYSSLKSRNEHPELFDAKVKFWFDAIQNFQTTYKLSHFTERGIIEFFQYQGIVPVCISQIIVWC